MQQGRGESGESNGVPLWSTRHVRPIAADVALVPNML